MNINFITSLERHGAEKQLLSIIKKKKSTVISIISGDLEEDFKKHSDLFILKKLNIRSFSKLIFALFKANALNIWLYHFLIPVCILGLILNKKIEINLRQDIQPKYSLNKFQKFSLTITKFLSHFMWRKITLIGNSKRSLESHINFGLKYNKCFIKSNKVNNNYFKKNIKIYPNKNSIKIITLARLDKSKNIPLELTLFQIINELNKFDMKLDIFGDNLENSEIKKYFKVFPKWLNVKNGININPEFFDQYDYYISCSLWEGQSNSIHEAASRGLHIITTKNGDSDIVAKSCEGTILKDNYIEQIVETFKKHSEIINRKEIRQKKYIDFYKTL